MAHFEVLNGRACRAGTRQVGGDKGRRRLVHVKGADADGFVTGGDGAAAGDKTILRADDHVDKGQIVGGPRQVEGCHRKAAGAPFLNPQIGRGDIVQNARHIGGEDNIAVRRGRAVRHTDRIAPCRNSPRANCEWPACPRIKDHPIKRCAVAARFDTRAGDHVEAALKARDDLEAIHRRRRTRQASGVG